MVNRNSKNQQRFENRGTNFLSTSCCLSNFKQKKRKQNLISTDDLLTGYAFIGYTGISIFLVFPIGDWFIICYTLQGLLFVQNDYL
jgi:hypothetical protein